MKPRDFSRMTPDEIAAEQARSDAWAARSARVVLDGRWTPAGDARVAQGLPRTKSVTSKRAPRFLDRESEPYWISEVRRLGLEDLNAGRTALRVQAKQLADAAMREVIDAENGPKTPPTDDELLESYWENEARRWHHRADRDAAMSTTHRDLAVQAEIELGNLRLRRNVGRAK